MENAYIALSEQKDKDCTYLMTTRNTNAYMWVASLHKGPNDPCLGFHTLGCLLFPQQTMLTWEKYCTNDGV